MIDVKILLGTFGDNSWLLWEGLRLKYNFYSSDYIGLYGIEKHNNPIECLTYLPFLFFSRFINAIDLWNIFVIFFILVSGIASYLYLRRNLSKLDSILLSLLWLANPYFSYHSREHLSLLACFLFIIFLFILRKNQKEYIIIKYLFLINSLFIATYLGIFLICINFSYTVIQYFRKHALLIDLVLALLLTFSLSIGLKIFFSQTSRSIDNFYIFSYKPWHSIDRPEGSVVNFYDFEIKVENIFFNYFQPEHSTGFFGILFLLLIFFTVLKFNKIIDIKIYILTAICFSISLGPGILIKNFFIPFPGYIFYFLFDQFRVTSRINIFTFYLMIIILSYLYKNLNNGISHKIIKILITTILFIDIFYPYKITKINTNNYLYRDIKNNTDKKSLIILYPENISLNIFSDMQFFQRKVVNPKGYESKNFVSSEFTKNLSCNEIKKFSIPTDNLYIIYQDKEILEQKLPIIHIMYYNDLNYAQVKCP